jgi:hypothetical protein
VASNDRAGVAAVCAHNTTPVATLNARAIEAAFMPDIHAHYRSYSSRRRTQ